MNIASRIILACVFTAAFSCSLVGQDNPLAKNRLGIVSEKPANGRFVKTDAGFMVPYSFTIPGTNVQIDMVPIPAGTVRVGSPAYEVGREEYEGPQVDVAIEPFWMGKYEITWAQFEPYMAVNFAFKRFADSKIRKITDKNAIDAITAPSALYDPSFTYDAGDELDMPAATMTQFSAKQFTKWLSLLSEDFYRLPSEAEWEHAARANSTSAYFFGDDPAELPKYGWFEKNSDFERHRVGQLKPNPWGLYDIYGNVAEWTLDQHENQTYQQLHKKMAVTMIDAINWPQDQYGRISKGGSWELPAEKCRNASRLIEDPKWKDEDPEFLKSPWWYTTYPGTGVGIRIVRPLSEPSIRIEKEKFWDEIQEIKDIAKHSISGNGRGAFGLVDKKLPDAIKRVKADGQRRPIKIK